MADIQLPAGWMALPGGNVYNPQTNQILTQSQAAYTFGVENPERFLTPQTPAAPPTPTYAMDENGNIGAASNPAFSYSVDQANQGYGMLNSQLAAQLTAQNPYGMAPVQVTGQAPNPTYAAPLPAPSMADPEWINWIMGNNMSPVNTTTQPIGTPQISPPGLQDIRNQVGGATPSFPTASPMNSGTTMLGSPMGTSMETQTNPQYSTVQDTSAWRAAPTALTPMQQAGRGMFYS